MMCIRSTHTVQVKIMPPKYVIPAGGVESKPESTMLRKV